MRGAVRQKGRPKMASGKRCRKIDVRFTEEEYQLLLSLGLELGLTKAEIIRSRVLGNVRQVLTDAKKVIEWMDDTGTELSRAGNNINQLARYSNILRKQDVFSQGLHLKFEKQLSAYIGMQEKLEILMRTLIRKLAQ